MLEFFQGNDLLLGIVGFAIVLIPAVIIHELGHFLAAKAVGITILEFGIGMPPRAVRLFRHQGTDYTLNWLPLGGFVRPLGEGIVSQQGDEETENDRTEAVERGIKNPKSVFEAKPLERIFFMSAGAIANFISAFVILMIVALLGLPEIIGARVVLHYVAPDSALAAAGLQSGDLLEAVNGERYLSRAELLNALYSAEGSVELELLRLNGETLAPITLTIEGLGLSAADVTEHPIIAGVAEDSPAEQAGLQVGDVITAFNGTPIESFEALRTNTSANLEREVTLTVYRDGEYVEAALTPRENPPEGQGAMGVSFAADLNAALDEANGLVAFEGVPQEAVRPQSIPAAAQFAWSQIGDVISTIAAIPGQLIQGTADPDALRPVGPVGIGQLSGLILNQSIENERPAQILQFIALVSISLGLTNLLPIPALDGGRILFVLIEILRGRPISPEREGMVHLVGLVLLLSLMVLVTFNDILSPITNVFR